MNGFGNPCTFNNFQTFASEWRTDAAAHPDGYTFFYFAGHGEEYAWWSDQVGKYVNDSDVDQDAGYAAAMTLVRWHGAWVAAQPQYERSLTLMNLGRRLENLGKFVQDPGCEQRTRPDLSFGEVGEAVALDEILVELTAVRAMLG